MPSTSRSRRTAHEEESSEEERPQNTQRKKGKQRAVEEDEEQDDDEEDENEMEIDAGEDSQDILTKKLVRYALACEYQRMPIRRSGITEKVIVKQRGRFKRTFDLAQEALRMKFGMEMVELPAREKVTMKERRAASKPKGGSHSTASYILTSVLPVKFRGPEIIPPSKIGDQAEEAAYTGLYTFIVTILALSPQGVMTEGKLKTSLARVEAKSDTPIDKTDVVLGKMIKQGYITKTTEKTDQDNTVEFRVGPRGKVEIGNKGIQGLVKEVYGQNAPEDLDVRLRRSLGIEIAGDMELEEEEDELEQSQVAVDAGPSRRSARR